jgi:hypothetical protein
MHLRTHDVLSMSGIARSGQTQDVPDGRRHTWQPQSVERHVEVILRPVADRIARMHEQVLHRKAHFAAMPAALSATSDGPGVGTTMCSDCVARVVPAVRVVGFERGGIDGLRVVLALQHKPVRRADDRVRPAPVLRMNMPCSSSLPSLAIRPAHTGSCLRIALGNSMVSFRLENVSSS